MILFKNYFQDSIAKRNVNILLIYKMLFLNFIKKRVNKKKVYEIINKRKIIHNFENYERIKI